MIYTPWGTKTVYIEKDGVSKQSPTALLYPIGYNNYSFRVRCDVGNVPSLADVTYDHLLASFVSPFPENCLTGNILEMDCLIACHLWAAIYGSG
jgi:hypothetical protein